MHIFIISNDRNSDSLTHYNHNVHHVKTKAAQTLAIAGDSTYAPDSEDHLKSPWDSRVNPKHHRTTDPGWTFDTMDLLAYI